MDQIQKEQAARAKFSFKIDRPTGRYASFSQTSCYIKLLGKECGSITEHNRLGNDYSISLMVDREPIAGSPAPFKTITLKYKPTSFDEAKTWLNTNKDKILNSFELYLLPE